MNSEYDWLDLEDDEEILWSDTPHPYSLLPSFVVGIPLSLLLIGLVIMAAAYLDYANKHYVVTTNALYKKTGIISRNVKRVEFEKVQDTSYRQSFLGTQFDFGVLQVSTAGGGGVELQFESVSEPQSLQSLINRQLRRHDDRQPDTDSRVAILDEILTEIRTIRSLVEGSEAQHGNNGDDSKSPNLHSERSTSSVESSKKPTTETDDERRPHQTDGTDAGNTDRSSAE